ncbi:MAG: hypothetical protein QXU32_11315 [Nitrososphaerales archaeon]
MKFKLTPAQLAAIFIGIGIAIVASFLILNFSPRPDLHVEVVRGTTPETSGGIEFMRIKITNYSGRDLTGVIIDMGPDDIHQIGRIKAGESILITPKSVGISRISINTNEGIGTIKDIT